ncbi:MAG: WYL domain-containing protein [Bacteroidota bacterium]
MPKIKSAVSRYHIIDACLNNKMKPYPTLEDLANECSVRIREGISTSTIEKDIRQMKMSRPQGYDAPIEYSKFKKGYFYAEQGFSITELKLEDHEWDGLRYAANLLHQYSNVSIFKDFKQAIDKINTRFNLLMDLEEADFDRYIQFETGNATNGYDWIGTILPAVKNRWIMNIRYENIYKKTVKEYSVYPKLLKEHRNRWYVIGWVAEREDYLTFALDRIQHIETVQKVQKHRFDFNADNFLQHTVGIMESDSNPSKVVLSILDPYHKLLQLEPIHHTQKEIKQNKNGIDIELMVNINPELINRILSMGSYCKVLQPASLKKQVKESLLKTIAYYK